MCRNLAIAATALMLSSMVLTPSKALAWGAKSAAPAPAPAPSQTPSKTAAAQPDQPRAKASPEVRAAADRLDPLGRAAFWAAQVNVDPKDAEAGTKLASSLRAIGRNQEAHEAIQAVLVQQPDNVEALLESVRVAVADNQGFFGIDAARRAMQLAPKDWRAPSLLAVSLDQIGRSAEALEAHRKAMQLAPENPVVLSNAAMFYAAQGDKAQAEVLLRKAVAEPGATLQVRQNLSMVLGLQGKFAESEQIQRQDLPPQMAANNLAYLMAAATAK